MQHIEDARRDLVQFMQDSGKSQRQISKETGLSATHFSISRRYIYGRYRGNRQRNTEISYSG